MYNISVTEVEKELKRNMGFMILQTQDIYKGEENVQK